MKKVKVFAAMHEYDLEVNINSWIEENDKRVSIINYQFATNQYREGTETFAAMIVYEDNE